MRRALALCLAIGGAGVFASPLGARDHGQHGAVFPVAEPDLLQTIEERLTHMQRSGALDRANRRLAASTEARVRRPVRVAGIATARTMRRWSHDPSIRLDHDLRDGAGRLIMAAGTQVNPLDTVKLRQALVFIDGDDPEQLRWSRDQAKPASAKLILIAGQPLALMRSERRRVYFDQGGTLVRHFGIRAVPARVVQTGRRLDITEFALPVSPKARP